MSQKKPERTVAENIQRNRERLEQEQLNDFEVSINGLGPKPPTFEDELAELLSEGRELRRQVHESFKDSVNVTQEDLDIRLR